MDKISPASQIATMLESHGNNETSTNIAIKFINERCPLLPTEKDKLIAALRQRGGVLKLTQRHVTSVAQILNLDIKPAKEDLPKKVILPDELIQLIKSKHSLEKTINNPGGYNHKGYANYSLKEITTLLGLSLPAGKKVSYWHSRDGWLDILKAIWHDEKSIAVIEDYRENR